MKKHFRFSITGVVQGVGFRPFVYRLAHTHCLSGCVFNNSQGVVIEIEGSRQQIDDFETNLFNSLPVLAKIDTFFKEELSLTHVSLFEILESEPNTSKYAMLPPDIAFCDDCKSDINNKNSRFHNYFLTTCTNCGPRYSIIENVPYDRANTSMKNFKMCNRCEAEYLDPINRRYHAQPISCPSCGPILSLYDHQSKLIETGNNAIEKLAGLIEQNHIVAVKGTGGFQLICSAVNFRVIKALREKKNRPDKPFAVMFQSIRQIQSVAQVSSHEEQMLLSKERPIVLLKRLEHCCLQHSNGMISESVAPHTDRIGAFLPNTPLHYLLFKHLKEPLIVTSANLGDEPIVTDYAQLMNKLGNVVEYVLEYDRDIVNACDDSVLQMIDDRVIMMRLARGYAPFHMKLPYKVSKPILAVGAQQKNSIALAFENQLILSPHIGNLDSIEAFEYFERTIETFKRLYDFKPELIVCDKHPDYETTKWARKQECEILHVQHHYAHVLACMLEHQLDEKMLAFSWDGTGYGDDATVWGGEVFIADRHEYERRYWLKPFKLLGGETAVKEPRRIALSLLFEQFTLDEILACSLPSVKAFSVQEITSLYAMWQKGLNSPVTTSMGRLFDAVASLGDFIQTVTYDGQSGLLIETDYDSKENDFFDFTIENNEINMDAMLQKIINIHAVHGSKKIKQQKIATMFINTLIEIMATIAARHCNLHVVLSGGVFQNKTLLENVLLRFEALGITCFFQQQTPINDGSIALGQLLAGIVHAKR